MRCRWRFALLVVTLVTNVVVPSLGQEDTTLTSATSTDESGAAEPTPAPETDAPDVPETPAPVEEAEETPGPTVDDEEDEVEETDPPDTPTPVEDTPSPTEADVPETPSPTEEEVPETPAPVVSWVDVVFLTACSVCVVVDAAAAARFPPRCRRVHKSQDGV